MVYRSLSVCVSSRPYEFSGPFSTWSKYEFKTCFENSHREWTPFYFIYDPTLRWRHNGHHSVSNHRSLGCLFYTLFKPTSKKTSRPALLVLCEENSPLTGEFSSQRTSNAENVSIWWRHNEMFHEVSLMYDYAPVAFAWCTNHFVHKVEFAYIGWKGVHPLWFGRWHHIFFFLHFHRNWTALTYSQNGPILFFAFKNQDKSLSCRT